MHFFNSWVAEFDISLKKILIYVLLDATNIESASILDVLRLIIHSYSLTKFYPNLEVAVRIFLTILVK